MSMESKVLLLNELRTQLSKKLTALDMESALSVMADELDHWDVERIEQESTEKDDCLTAYLSAMQIQGRSEKTIERYRYIIQRLKDAVNVTTRKITVYHIRQYLSSEKARGISNRTLESNREVYNAYFNWLQREGLIRHNPCANLGAVKYEKRVKDIYSEVDIERMKFACENVRNMAIIAFLESTGCRISEMVKLNRDSVDLNNLECRVIGKGDKERTVFLSPVAGMILRNYLSFRKDLHPALFIGKGTERFSPGGVRKMLKSLGEKADVKHVHPHKFRRTCATNLIRHGMPIQEVAAILGHEKLDTTMQYVVLDKSDIRNSYRKYA